MKKTFRVLAFYFALASTTLLGGCESSGSGSSNIHFYGSIYAGYGYYNPWYWHHYWYRPPYWGPPRMSRPMGRRR